MSHIVAQPGRNAARQAKKLKEIRKVKGAIVWHERERTKRQKLFQERWESKQAVIQRLKWENENVKKVRKTALDNAREDWQLGSLRPNRAIGVSAEKYGARTGEQMQKPDIPVHTQKNRNETRAKRGLEPEYPLVVDDTKWFPFRTDDRVVVVNGREKGKIGVVQDIVSRTHEIIVKGVNMQYYDSNVFSSSVEGMGPKQEREVPISIDDVRLVIPYETSQRIKVKHSGEWVDKFVKNYQDVVVDKITMERHTTGIDPFTGTDYGDAEIPKDHQYDPSTGLPIFHRYIAGTRHRIEWPWEKEEEMVENSGVTTGEEANKQSIIRKTFNTLRHPIASLKQWTSKEPEKRANEFADVEKTEKGISREITAIEQELLQTRKTARPKSVDPRYSDAFDNTDTTRNIVEGADSMSYTLIAPPFPDTLFDELRSDIQDFSIESRKNDTAPRVKLPKKATAQGMAAGEVARAKHAAALKMKTPMQLRWESEHAKKLKQQKKAPLVSTDELMAALGAHIQQHKAMKSSPRVGDVD